MLVFLHSMARDQRPALGHGCFIENLTNRVQQFRLANGLDEIGGDAEFLTTSGVTELTGRCKHHDGHRDQARVFQDLSSQCKAIHVRHLTVDQDKRERLASALGDLECLDCRPATFDRSGTHPPTSQHAMKDAAICGIVVHDERV